jgi:hypothetical protein|tara:strand:- start:2922 stop:4196 length:1275 start_codon:yes stop_codon:yes gene_type:complete
MEINQQVLQEKWAPVLDSQEAGKIGDAHRRRVTAVVLENSEKAFAEENQLTEAAAANMSNGTGVSNWDPVLISLVRRATPAMLAFDLVGVQPMTGPTGLIFAMKSRYSTQGGTEALFAESDTGFSGAANGSTTDSNDPFAGDTDTPADVDDYTPGSGNSLATAEAQGTSGSPAIPEMAFSIDKTTVTAKSRALKAEYTTELAQDLKAIHGLSAETELANILSTEILAEMNREIIRLCNVNSVTSTRGASAGTWNATNAADNGGARWSIERYKALVQAIEHEANKIAVDTRRGKGNWVMVSNNVAAALNAAGVMDTGLGALGAQAMDSDVTGSLRAGTLNGNMAVYIDPYASVDYFTVGYKGANPYDAGMFYCPYVPLSMMKTIGENDFQPRIGFKTRYGIADNPFVTAGAGANVYYRKRKVTNL